MVTMQKKAKLRYWDISLSYYDEVMDAFEFWRTDGEKHYVCFCDANGLAHGWRDDELKRAYRDADAVFADGVSLKWLARISDGKTPRHVMGPVLFEKAMEFGIERGWQHFFYGAAPGTAEKLKAKMEARFPGVRIAGTFSPPFGELSDDEWESVKNMIAGAKADFLWVALGSPKQEKWTRAHYRELPVAVTLPVGAAFDFYAGTAKTSPMWVQRAGLNWLWRLVTGGKRVFKRNAWCLPRALWILITEFWRIRMIKSNG
jgi:N-acetylglucosaminyldiphosphoundecaprenol N-acetyl-beta-D-mannosaminyltransferase